MVSSRAKTGGHRVAGDSEGVAGDEDVEGGVVVHLLAVPSREAHAGAEREAVVEELLPEDLDAGARDGRSGGSDRPDGRAGGVEEGERTVVAGLHGEAALVKEGV